jgi:hypothetical protein
MTIDISNNAARVNYTVAQGATQTSFSVPFEFFNDADLSVYVDDVLKTITTHYTVSGGDGSTGTITMSVTGASGGSTVVISRSIAIERTSDFVTGVDINRAALNTQLDTLTAIAADNKDKASRSISAPNSEVNPQLELPDADTRKGKLVGFNETTGNVELTASIADVNTLAAITSDIATLADIEDGTDATDAIQTVASISSDVTTVIGISSNIATVSGISGDVTTVAGISSNVTTAANNTTNINTVAANDADITVVSGISGNVTTVAGISADVTAVAGDAADIGIVGSNISDVTTAASNIVAIQNASANAATATTKADEASASAAAALVSENAAAASQTASAASQVAAADSAAAAAAALDNFDDRYLGSKASDPTLDNDGNALVSGALYFNSTDNEMRVYDGANWIAASSAGAASLILYEYTATSGQTTFSGADDNSASLSYSVGNIQVVMNGIVLDPSDFTATSGTSVILASGAATGDLVNIYAFKSFTVADTVSASAGGTFAGNITAPKYLSAGNKIETDIFRVNAQTLSSNTTIDADENASATGPLAVASGVTLAVTTGGNLSIV